MNCGNCQYCVYKKSTYEDGYINTCLKADSIQELSNEDILKGIENGCPFFEEGIPSFNVELTYDD